MQHLRNHWLFYTLLLIGLVVRSIFMVDQGFSNDELSAWYRTRYTTWDSFWYFGVKHGDMHPAFYQVLLWIWVRIFGDSEFAIRSTSLIFYCLNSFLIYRIGIKHFTRFSGLLLQGLYVGLTFTIINTVFARPYNSGVFFLLLAFLAILEIKKKNAISWKWILLLALGLWGAMVSHYFAFLVAVTLGGCSLFYVGKKNIKQVLIAAGNSILAFLPHLTITLYQVGRGGLQWLAPPKIDWPIEFIYLFFNNSWILFSVFSLLFVVVIVKYRKKGVQGVSIFSFVVFFTSFLIAFLLSHLFTPILRELVMLFLLPFLFLPLFSLIKVNAKQSVILVGMVTFLTTTDSFLRNKLLEPIHFGVFKEIGEEINTATKKYSSDSITFASNYNNIDYINYYLAEDLTEPIINWEEQETFYQLNERVEKSETPYFCYSVNNKFHSPMFLEIIRRKYPHVESSLIAGNSLFFLFGKNKGREKRRPFQIVKAADTSFVELEFFNNGKMKVGELPIGKDKSAYYLIASKGKLLKNVPLHLVVAIERESTFLMNGEFPALYLAYDQSRLVNQKKEEQEFYCAFQLPKEVLPTDDLIFYFWNPEKGKVKVSNVELYLIEDLITN